jgi:hypothetical protein
VESINTQLQKVRAEIHQAEIEHAEAASHQQGGGMAEIDDDEDDDNDIDDVSALSPSLAA